MKLVFIFLLLILYVTADGKAVENVEMGKEHILTENFIIYHYKLFLPFWEFTVDCFFTTGDTTRLKRPLKIWVYTNNDKLVKGLLTAVSDSVLFIDPSKGNSSQSASIASDSINIIKTRKKGSTLKGLGIGAGIGIIPAFFGEGGAYAAVITFPVGIITGTVIGATSKKKYIINGNAASFAQFVHKVSR